MARRVEEDGAPRGGLLGEHQFVFFTQAQRADPTDLRTKGGATQFLLLKDYQEEAGSPPRPARALAAGPAAAGEGRWKQDVCKFTS